jgi:hypothetical protein
MCSICDVRITFGIDHPMGLSVAVATRRGIEAGVVPQARGWERAGAIGLMQGVRQRLEWSLSREALAALPAFFVLLVETRPWAYFHPGPDGFDPAAHRAPPDAFDAGEDPVVVAAETTLAPMLKGRLPFARAAEAGMLHLDAPEPACGALSVARSQAWPAAFSRLVCA